MAMAISGKLSWPMRVHTNEDGDKTTVDLVFLLICFNASSK